MSFSDKYGWGRPEPVLLPPTPGRLLVATPELPDPAFSHTVVLLIAAQHGGWLGVVLNRPSDSRVDEVLPRWADHVSAPAVMFFGGPVELDSVVGLSSNNQTVDLAGDLPSSLDEPDLRLFAGSSQWSSEQLEIEIDEGSWWVFESEHGDATTADPSTLWPRVLRRQGGRTAWFALATANPAFN